MVSLGKQTLLQLAFFIMAVSVANAALLTPLLLDDKHSHNLSGHLEFLTDPTCQLTVQQVVDRSDWSGPVHKQVLNLGITKSAVWLRFFLTNQANTTQKFYVSFEYPVANSVTFYTKSPSGFFEEQHAGSTIPASGHVVPDRHFLFPLSIEAGKTVPIYMRIQSTSGMTIPIRILSDHALDWKASRDHAIYGALFGFFALVLIYFITSGYFLHRATSFWLALYSVLFSLHMAVRAGFIHLLVPDKLLGINSLLHLIIISGLYFAGAKFFRLFLSLKDHSKLSDTIMMVFQYLSILFALLALFPNSFLTAVSLVLFVINPIFSICLAFYFWHKGISNAGYFAVGWIVAHFVSVYDFFRINGMLSYPEYNEWLIPFSLLIAFIFLSVALIKQNIAAQFMAKTDPLTHLANRRKFNEVLQLEWNRCLRQNTPLSLIMADMDYFKQYNDSFGHRAGDQLLCSIAEVLNRYTQRPGDLAARYGGDEFVLLLPNIDAKSAFNLAKTIRRVINNKKNQRSDNNVTISIGIATTIPTKENKPEKLVLDVDKALYEAKHRGKNCTVVSTSSGINMPGIL